MDVAVVTPYHEKPSTRIDRCTVSTIRVVGAQPPIYPKVGTSSVWLPQWPQRLRLGDLEPVRRFGGRRCGDPLSALTAA